MGTSSAKPITSGSAVTDGAQGKKRVSIPIPLPCIVILIHGVNDVGEAYSAQETGLCKGLNARLNRSHELNANAIADLIAAEYRKPPATTDEVVKEGVLDDPDVVYYRRSIDPKSWSPIIPFYWGSREEEAYIHKNPHRQWTDRYGNRLNKNGAINGGPFPNATTTLNDMWGEGFTGKIAGSRELAEKKSKEDPTHNLEQACSRHYMLLAAKRLAMLIKMIRNQAGYEHVAINVVCHSQGSMITLLAHAMLADDGGFSADTLIFQDPPYSFEEPIAEEIDGVTGQNQQTAQSRIKTLSNIIKYVKSKKATTPQLADLDFCRKLGKGVAGPNWQAGAGAKKYIDKEYTFTERDNRGKVYLYFCPQDKTVSLRNVQGMGWQGVPDTIKIWEKSKDAFTGITSETLNVLPVLGDNFRQRVFTSRTVGGGEFAYLPPAQIPEKERKRKAFGGPIMVGEKPRAYEMRNGDASPTSGAGNAEIEDKAVRMITGEELNPPIKTVLTTGELAGHAGTLLVSSIDASIAASSPYGCNPGESEDAARLRWQSTRYTENSYHSGIPSNPDHAVGVTAYDISIGMPVPLPEKDKTSGMYLDGYMEYLRAVADWRTNWDAMSKNQASREKKIMEYRNKEKTAGAVDLINATTTYYSSGVLPDFIEKKGQAILSKPSLMAHQSVGDRLNKIPVK